MGVAVAAPAQHGLRARALDAALQPDLAGAALDLVGVAVRFRGERGQHAAEFDQVAVALLPIVQEFEVRDDLVHRGQHGVLRQASGTASHIGARGRPGDWPRRRDARRVLPVPGTSPTPSWPRANAAGATQRRTRQTLRPATETGSGYPRLRFARHNREGAAMVSLSRSDAIRFLA